MGALLFSAKVLVAWGQEKILPHFVLFYRIFPDLKRGKRMFFCLLCHFSSPKRLKNLKRK